VGYHLSNGHLTVPRDLAKLSSQRIETMQIPRVRLAVRRYSPQDSEDLESLIYLGKLGLSEA